MKYYIEIDPNSAKILSWPNIIEVVDVWEFGGESKDGYKYKYKKTTLKPTAITKHNIAFGAPNHNLGTELATIANMKNQLYWGKFMIPFSVVRKVWKEREVHKK